MASKSSPRESASFKHNQVEQDITIRELTLSNNQAHTKNIQLRGEIQSLNDRLAGLVKENDTLKREATARKIIIQTFDRVKMFLGSFKNIPNIFKNQSLEK